MRIDDFDKMLQELRNSIPECVLDFDFHRAVSIYNFLNWEIFTGDLGKVQVQLHDVHETALSILRGAVEYVGQRNSKVTETYWEAKVSTMGMEATASIWFIEKEGYTGRLVLNFIPVFGTVDVGDQDD